MDEATYKEYQKRYREKNKDKLKKYRKNWYANNKDRVNRWGKEYRAKNRERIIAIQKKSRAKYGSKYKQTYVSSIHGFAVRAIGAVKKRSKLNGLSNNLDFEFLEELWKEQNGVCPITGISMDLGTGKINYRRASIDRIDSSKGYEKGNVRWVCYWANLAKHMMSDRELIEFCILVANNQT